MDVTGFTPYYAVIFTSILTEENSSSYAEMSVKMEKLAKTQEGYLGMESAREQVGITISYWKSVESIRKWKQNLKHLEAQNLGKSKWYKSYSVRITKVEREYTSK